MMQICGKWLKNVIIWLKYLTIDLNVLEVTQRFGKCETYLGNGLDTWDTA